ncbi:AlpA family phage regulatory protein [Brucella sp. TWI432]
MSKSVSAFKKLISIREVCSLTSLSRTTLWMSVKRGAFPKPISLTPEGTRKAFVADEVQSWIEGRISLRDQKDAV